MKEWIEHIVRGPVPAALVLSFLFTTIGVKFAPAEDESGEPVFYETGALVPDEGQNIKAHVVGAHRTASVHHLVVTERVAAHHHKTHDETVIILGGEGNMTIDSETRKVRAGDVLMIPRGTVHSFDVTEAPAEAVSVFSPPFDGEDRHFVD